MNQTNQNLSRIQSFSRTFRLLTRFLMVAVPVYYVIYWVFINYLPQTLINVNTAAQPILDNTLSVPLQWLGFLAALPVILSLIYGLVNIDRLFRYYQQGIIFSYQQVRLFKHIAKALLLWVVTSMLYESAKSVVFTWQNPPGERLLTVGFGSAELMIMIVAAMTFFIAWVVEEGQNLSEEQKYTV
ncbi:DUF2975 domain-containing protein [Thiomicrospira sp. S5]|uniref:DUF2975 domain-containing protein n=1 Tax=Thiomicrospira sp. S5 TaxID=1803865 RepID=UPI0004A73001|nr:DUF2975 domain-containing protein [Thiomicrospira sp. S5]AZR82323.1 hypothetical protein AYJ59_08520 [Thiomicrospira sp. S5]